MDKPTGHALRAKCWIAGIPQWRVPVNQGTCGLFLDQSIDFLQRTCRGHDQDSKTPLGARCPSGWSRFAFARYYPYGLAITQNNQVWLDQLSRFRLHLQQTWRNCNYNELLKVCINCCACSRCFRKTTTRSIAVCINVSENLWPAPE